jgi:L-fucose isomerase-like protein
VDAFKSTDASAAVRSLAKQYGQKAEKMTNAARKDLIEGVRAYAAAARVIKKNKGDAITMDCLGMGQENPGVPLPCLGWSHLNDTALPAICEADAGAIVAHIMTHYLFDRPGFQQDPVADTDNDSVIGAHCSCATRLNGYDEPSEPFNLSHHHALRDITTQTMWQEGQRVTSLEVYPGEPSTLEIATGEVIGQLSVPPHGGCVVSVNVKFDGVERVRDFPGFHQVWFYGDRGDELEEFAQLCGYECTRLG